MRRFMKFLHTTGSFGFAGGMAALMMLVHSAPAVGTPEYASLRAGLDFLSFSFDGYEKTIW